MVKSIDFECTKTKQASRSHGALCAVLSCLPIHTACERQAYFSVRNKGEVLPFGA